MRFIETAVFTAAIQRLLDDERYRRLQIALVLRPELGRVIPGSGGLRKVRWAGKGGGKRGSIRVVYRWRPAERTIYMLYAYTKSEQGDLTRAQIRLLGRLVREAFE